jgi:hypothetical protein
MSESVLVAVFLVAFAFWCAVGGWLLARSDLRKFRESDAEIDRRNRELAAKIERGCRQTDGRI